METNRPPDQDQRSFIEDELKTTILIEAAAGTGKTTCMIKRMTALLAAGLCQVQNMAAVTFTRKSAAELRLRFHKGLEDELKKSSLSEKTRLTAALSQMERCFIGTIHSFCARLLRERPVEAKVDFDFQEIDDQEDMRLRRKVWDDFTASMFASSDPRLKELNELGIEIRALWPSFNVFADYPDVEDWPAPAVPPPDFSEVRLLLLEAAENAERIRPYFPAGYGEQTNLMRKYDNLSRWVKYTKLDDREAVNALKLFTSIEGKDEMNSGKWPDERIRKEQCAGWKEYTKMAKDFLVQWKKHCYPACISLLKAAKEYYDANRNRSARLNYQDLLIQASMLLKNDPKVRNYFRKRFSHILVDEFQDTDPVQAEVMFFLTADNVAETQWQKCRPVPGSLFVVGDPKQSIYRFRRADIVTYNKVKEIIEDHGKVLTLQANFRSSPKIIEWVNGAFKDSFPKHETPEAPVYVPLLPGKPDVQADESRVYRLEVPAKLNGSILQYEAEMIASTISNMINERGFSPADFLIITRNRRNPAKYGDELQKLGIPHQVTGGNALNISRELSLLHKCLNAVIRPDNPVALVAALRSELFGISDTSLYEFRRCGGIFCYTSSVPESLSDENRLQISQAFQKLCSYAEWFSIMPAVSAVDRIIADLGLAAAGALEADGNTRAGSLFKTLELLRSAQSKAWTLTDLMDYLSGVLAGEDKHDGMPALPTNDHAVQIMNLHKVKGLEAPIVFLADPTGAGNVNPSLHIDRSADKVVGYLKIEELGFGHAKNVLALPKEWEKLKDLETKFEKAERTRLLYVAATRAGRQIIITQKEGSNRWNPWEYFGNFLNKDLPSPEINVAPIAEKQSETDFAVSFASAEIERSGKWLKALSPTYTSGGVKAVSLTDVEHYSKGSEFGTEWGSAIHDMLQALALHPEIDLSACGRNALEKYELDLDLLGAAVGTVLSVSRSEIWKRASGAVKKLVEVPFQLQAHEIFGGDAPGVLRGVIDLAFYEPQTGWVIVDYKTDSNKHAGPDALVSRYSGQLINYAKAWKIITGTTPVEAGLYFTSFKEYRTVRIDV